MDTVNSPSEDAVATQQLLQLINGYRVTQAIYVVATLGIPDLLAEGARSSRDLAESTHSNVDALDRVLRALAAVSIFNEQPDGNFTLTEIGVGLRSDAPTSRSAWAKFIARPPMWNAWGQLLHTVRTGENSFRHLHGKDTWQFRADDAVESQIFDAAMRESSARTAAEVLAHYDFAQFGHIIDVGGGDGTLLAAILAQCPEAQGTLLDLPHVVGGAKASFAGAGVTDRATAVAGNFFGGVLPDGDAYLLKHIVHDWEDPEAIAILQACRRAAVPGAKVLLIERVMDESNSSSDAAFSDLNMLVNAGGRERSRQQFDDLLTVAGLTLRTVVSLPGPNCIIEAVPA